MPNGIWLFSSFARSAIVLQVDIEEWLATNPIEETERIWRELEEREVANEVAERDAAQSTKRNPSRGKRKKRN